MGSKRPDPNCKYCSGTGFISLGNDELVCKCTNPDSDKPVPGVRDIV